MKRNLFVSLLRRQMFSFAAIGALAIAVSPLQADGVDKGDDAVQAELFAAIDSGQIDVKYIPQDATKANMIVRNLTDRPLTIALPSTFAGVPVNAQLGGGGGFMRIPPERMKKMALTTVCLEHGKPDPNPKMAYKIVPLQQFTKDPSVHVLCEALGKKMVTQNTAQAAAWHMLDNVSWNELAQKNRVESKYTGNVRWFNAFELKTAMAVVNEAKRIAEENAKDQPTKKDYDGRFDG